VATLGALHRILNLAVDMGHLAQSPIGYNPFPKVKHWPNWKKNPRTRGDVIDDDQAAGLVEHLKARAANWQSYRLYSMVCTALYTPFFRSEILYLKTGNYDPAAGVIRLQYSGRRGPAEFPILDEHRPSLDGWVGMAGGGWLYPNHLKRETPWTTNRDQFSANHAVKAAGAEGGIPRLTLESLRFYRYTELRARLVYTGRPRGGGKRLSLPIVLRGRDDPPDVLGKPWDKTLTGNEYDTVRALIDVYPGGLSWAELDAASGHDYSRTTVKRLKAKGLDAVIRNPEESPTPLGKCRIVSP
jgi:hypothetical protein